MHIRGIPRDLIRLLAAGLLVASLYATLGLGSSTGLSYAALTSSQHPVLVNQAAGTSSSSSTNPTGFAPTSITLPSNAALDSGVGTPVEFCTSTGNCELLNTYGINGIQSLYAQVETDSSWQNPTQLSLPANSIGGISLSTLTCTSAGNCEAVGTYSTTAASNPTELFAITETNGTWGTGIELTLPTNASSSGQDAPFSSGVSSLTCTSAGNCEAAGTYSTNAATNNLTEPFAITETNGTWGTGIELTLPSNASSSVQDGSLYSLTCTSAGNCEAVGSYFNQLGDTEPVIYQSTLSTPPAITSITPASGLLSGGSTITITGTNFTGATSVDFGTTAATSFTVVSSTEITAVVPSATAPGLTEITVTTPEGVSATSSTTPGYLYLTSSVYTPVTPYRICDTRANNPSNLSGLDLTQCEGKTLGPNSSLTIQVAGTNPSGTTSGGAPTDATAAVLNVTVTNTTATSYLTAYPTGVTQPVSSNLNWVANETTPNLIEVPIGANGDITLYNSAGSTDVIVDVEGYVTPAPSSITSTTPGLFVPVNPYRICDTRSGNPSNLSGLDLTQCEGKTLGPSSSLTIQAAGTNPSGATSGGVPTGASAVVLNVTVTNTTATSYLTAYPAGVTQPLSSNLNWVANETVPNRVIIPVNPSTGDITLYNFAGSADVIVDVAGYYTSTATATTAGSTFTPVSPYRICDTRSGNPSNLSGLDLSQCEGKTLGPNSSLAIQAAGTNPSGTTSGGVPTGASAVVLNVTVTNTTATSYLTAYPAGLSSPPIVSDLNWTQGDTVPNLVVVNVSSSGQVALYNSLGSTDLIVDVLGYYG